MSLAVIPPPKRKSDSALVGPLMAAFVVVGGIVVGLSAPWGGRAVETISLRVDANTAPPQVLMALPALGPARVKAIERARSEAPLHSIADLQRRVKGIGPVISQGLAPYLRFPEPSDIP